MPGTVAVIARTRGLALSAAPHVRGRLGRIGLRPGSLRGYLEAESPPRRVVLCAGDGPLADEIAFLRLARERILWPAPAAELGEAVEGIRPRAARGPSPARPGATPARAGRVPAALLLEGPVGPDRVRAALAAGAPRHWIVEDVTRVRLPDALLEELARAGIRWSALQPVELVALCVPPGLARARRRWRALLPPHTPVWVRISERAGPGPRARADG
jgi:hypothetical protein